MPKPGSYDKSALENSVYNEWAAELEELKKLNDPESSDLVDAVEKLLSLMKTQYTDRNDMGNFLPMTEDTYHEIQTQYKKCLNVFDQLASNLKELPIYKKLRTMLLNDSNALNGLSADSLPPLAEVIVGSEVPVAELYETSAENTIGAALSSREAIEFIDPNGQVHRAFFTEDKIRNTQMDDFLNVLNDYSGKYPTLKPLFDKLKEEDPVELANEVYNLTHTGGGISDFNQYINRKINGVYPENAQPNMTWVHDVCVEMGKKLEQIRNFHSVSKGSGIEKGSHIAPRAAAMSDVAAVLGKKDLLAASHRVTVKRGDKTVSGVMMEAAELDSVDASKLTDDNPYYKLDNKEFDKPEVLKALADLQILDYLCANTDRHKHNFFMRIDNTDPKNPKLTGVQGIDNDNSFGTLTDGGVMKLASAKNLKVITADMAKKILKMTSSDLNRILEPYQFTKQELYAAGTRLQTLQQMIKQGKKTKNSFSLNKEQHLATNIGEILTIQDDEWKNLTLAKLVPDKTEQELKNRVPDEGNNLFLIAKELKDSQSKQKDVIQNRKEMREHYVYAGKKRNLEELDKNEAVQREKDKKKKEPIRYIRFDEQGFWISLEKQLETEQKKLEDINKKLEDAGAKEEKRSGKFKAMFQKSQMLVDNYGKLLQKLQGMKTLDDNKKTIMADGLQKLVNECRELKKTASVYLKKGYISTKGGLEERKKLAKELFAFAENGPECQRQYEKMQKLAEEKEKKIAKMEGLAASSYYTNQLRDMMKQTLRDNVTALDVNDEKRQPGIKALKAQERLWNFSQTILTYQSEADKEARKQKQKEKTDYNQLNIRKQITVDMAAIMEYEPKVKKMVEAYNTEMTNKAKAQGNVKTEHLLIDAKTLTPRQARTLLGMLFEVESKKMQERCGYDLASSMAPLKKEKSAETTVTKKTGEIQKPKKERFMSEAINDMEPILPVGRLI